MKYDVVDTAITVCMLRRQRWKLTHKDNTATINPQQDLVFSNR